MIHLHTVLQPSFDDLSDTLSDFRSSARHDSANGLLRRVTLALEAEPLLGFLKATTPESSFEQWWHERCGGRELTSGYSSIDWPPDRSLRVSLQVEFCHWLVRSDKDVLSFARRHYGSQSKHHADVFRCFADELLAPLIRDIRRLSEHRVLPPILFEAMGRLPDSGDSTLDALLKQACDLFRDPAPDARKQAVEKLWDAWERAKTLRGNDKKQSADDLLRDATDCDDFLRVLNEEANALTRIGNNFYIRHFEVDKAPIRRPEHYDYLFHRLYALLHLLLFSTSKSSASQRLAQGIA